MEHRTIRGKLLYTSTKPERMGHERGRETFIVSVHGDGARTLNAHCEIDDAPTVLRDVTLSWDKNWAPLDCFNRLTIADKFEGSGWFRFTDTVAEGETFNQRDGRLSQRMELEQPVRWLGTHPLVADAMCFSVFDRSGPKKQYFPDMMLTSPDHRGATGPMLFRVGFGLEYLGDETIEVPAGKFDCHKFQYTDTAEGGLPEEHPPYQVWCTADEDFIFVRGAVGGYMQTFYELVELER